MLTPPRPADLSTFQSPTGHTLRTILREGEPWFVAADVAQSLDYRMASDMTRSLDDDEKGTQMVRTPSGDQEMLVINESGLYSAILKSRKPTGHALRAILRDGEPWFIAKDLCEALGIENSRDAVRSLNPDERITVAIPDGNRGNPNKTLVNESGFYKLAMRSDKPEAGQMQRNAAFAGEGAVVGERVRAIRPGPESHLARGRKFQDWVTGTVLPAIRKDGEPWFIAKDVFDALGLSDTSMALASLSTRRQCTR